MQYRSENIAGPVDVDGSSEPLVTSVQFNQEFTNHEVLRTPKENEVCSFLDLATFNLDHYSFCYSWRRWGIWGWLRGLRGLRGLRRLRGLRGPWAEVLAGSPSSSVEAKFTSTISGQDIQSYRSSFKSCMIMLIDSVGRLLQTVCLVLLWSIRPRSLPEKIELQAYIDIPTAKTEYFSYFSGVWECINSSSVPPGPWSTTIFASVFG